MTTLELVDTNRAAITSAVLKEGEATFTVPASKRLQIKNTDEGDHMFNEQCPSGKSWEAKVIVRIIETTL